jgi:hypothetical protein
MGQCGISMRGHIVWWSDPGDWPTITWHLLFLCVGSTQNSLHLSILKSSIHCCQPTYPICCRRLEVIPSTPVPPSP